jgi:signal transduction histidine kinase
LSQSALHTRIPQSAHNWLRGAVHALPLIAPPEHETLDVLILTFPSQARHIAQRPTELDTYAAYAALALQTARQLSGLHQALRGYQDRYTDLIDGTRAPLTAIQGYIRLLAKPIGGELTDQQRDFLQTIQRNADRLQARLKERSAP